MRTRNRGLPRRVSTLFITLVGKYCFAVSTMDSVMLVVPVEVSPWPRLGNAPGSSFPGVTAGDLLVTCSEVVFWGVS